MSNSRNDFSQATIRNLAMSTNFRCARPGCGKVTHIYDPARGSTVNIQGQAAHIIGASDNGPRPEVTMTSEQKRSFDNGVWLCANCATLIDRLPNDYPRDMLLKWQRDAIDRIRMTGFAGDSHPAYDVRSDARAVREFLNPVDLIISPDWMPGMRITVRAVDALRKLAGIGSRRGIENQALAVQSSVRDRQLAMCELATASVSAFNGIRPRFLPVADAVDNTLIGYRVPSKRFPNDTEISNIAQEDIARHGEFYRLAQELRCYLVGEGGTLRDVFW